MKNWTQAELEAYILEQVKPYAEAAQVHVRGLGVVPGQPTVAAFAITVTGASDQGPIDDGRSYLRCDFSFSTGEFDVVWERPSSKITDFIRCRWMAAMIALWELVIPIAAAAAKKEWENL